MKIMLVCAGGMSTGILVNKIKKYAADNDLNITVNAYGIGTFTENMNQYDLLLLAPQVSYKEADVREASSIPVGMIQSMDYALGNAEAIVKQAKELSGGESND